MTYIISDEALAAAAARIAAKHLAPAPAPSTPAPPGFTYKPRTLEHWQKRIDQSWQSNRGFRPPKPATPRVELDLEISEKKPKAKAVTENTPCTCGHTHGMHDTARPSYPALKGVFAIGDCSLITTPCKVNIGCDCWNFTDAETGKAAKLKRPAVLPHVLCKKCGHARQDHCTAHKNKLQKSGEWLGFKRDGRVAACQHTTMDVFYRCSTTSCAAAVGQEFCSCLRFVSPLTLPKVAKPASKPRKSCSRNVSAPDTDTPPTHSTSEIVPAKPRRTRQKKSRAFVTGRMLPFETVTEVQTK